MAPRIGPGHTHRERSATPARKSHRLISSRLSTKPDELQYAAAGNGLLVALHNPPPQDPQHGVLATQRRMVARQCTRQSPRSFSPVSVASQNPMASVRFVSAVN